MIDLRSDTVTRPSAGMREAMATAEVGDDVYAEDPTINALEAEVAALFGHEAALFTPTGSMANQIAIQLVVPPAEELLCDADAHVVTYEIGAAAALSGISTRTWVSSPVGSLDVDAVAAQVRAPAYGAVPTRAVAVENTHNRGGGAVLPLDALRELRAFTAGRGVSLHCDGARIWNASVATGTPLAAYGARCSTPSRCACRRGWARRSGRWWCRRPGGSSRRPRPGRCRTVWIARRSLESRPVRQRHGSARCGWTRRRWPPPPRSRT